MTLYWVENKVKSIGENGYNIYLGQYHRAYKQLILTS